MHCAQLPVIRKKARRRLMIQVKPCQRYLDFSNRLQLSLPIVVANRSPMLYRIPAVLVDGEMESLVTTKALIFTS